MELRFYLESLNNLIKVERKMKISIGLTGLVAASERKFTNKPEFMEAETPDWWTNKPALDRMATLECKRADYFETYFGSTASKVQGLWADVIEDIKSAVNKRGCLNDPNLRKRRDVGDENRAYNACTDWKENDAWKDTDLFVKFIGVFVREVDDDQAKCQRIGNRLVSGVL